MKESGDASDVDAGDGADSNSQVGTNVPGARLCQAQCQKDIGCLLVPGAVPEGHHRCACTFLPARKTCLHPEACF